MGLKYRRVAPRDYEFGLAEGTLRRPAGRRCVQPEAWVRDFGRAGRDRGRRLSGQADPACRGPQGGRGDHGWAGLWLRVDGAQRGTTPAFDNMEDQHGGTPAGNATRSC